MCRLPFAGDSLTRWLDWAESGVVALTGRRVGPPVLPPGCAASWARDVERGFRSLVDERTAKNLPLGWHRLLGERAAMLGLKRSAPFNPSRTCRAVATSDGWLVLNLVRAADRDLIPALVERNDTILDGPALWSAVERWAKRLGTRAAVARGALLGIPLAAVGTFNRVPKPVVEHEVRSGPKPRHGVRPLVVDLSVLWAGPLCTSLLHFTGARVVKVEIADRLDGARYGDARFYGLLHAGHDSVVIDRTSADDRRLLELLLERADIVVTSSRPRAMESLGIEPRAFCLRSPTTWVAITAWGPAHPDQVGFGDDVAMSAGLFAREAGDGRPLPVGDAIADPLTGIAAALGALRSYQRGGSRILEVSMRDVVASTIRSSSGDAIVIRTRRGWAIQDASASWPIEQATAFRSSAGNAAPPGAHTEHWRTYLVRNSVV